jgi:hypothetical protein
MGWVCENSHYRNKVNLGHGMMSREHKLIAMLIRFLVECHGLLFALYLSGLIHDTIKMYLRLASQHSGK